MPFNPYTGRYDMAPQPYAPSFQNPAYPEQITKVTGMDGARAVQLAPNSSKICIDETRENRLFLIMTDGAGFKTIRPMRCEFEDVEPERHENPLEDRMCELEKRMKELEVSLNDKNNFGNNRKRNDDANAR